MAKTRAPAPPPPPPAELPPPPAALPAELLASLPPPPPPAVQDLADVQVKAGAFVDALADAHEALSVARAEIDRLSKENAELRQEVTYVRGCADRLQAQVASRPAAAKHGAPRRNFAFQISNGSRRVIAATSEREAREQLGVDAAEAKFKGCLP